MFTICNKEKTKECFTYEWYFFLVYHVCNQQLTLKWLWKHQIWYKTKDVKLGKQRFY